MKKRKKRYLFWSGGLIAIGGGVFPATTAVSSVLLINHFWPWEKRVDTDNFQWPDKLTVGQELRGLDHKGYLEPTGFLNFPNEGARLRWSVKNPLTNRFSNWDSPNNLVNTNLVKLRLEPLAHYYFSSYIYDSDELYITDLNKEVPIGNFSWPDSEEIANLVQGYEKSGYFTTDTIPGWPETGVELQWAVVKQGLNEKNFNQEHNLKNGDVVQLKMVLQDEWGWETPIAESPLSEPISGLLTLVNTDNFEWPTSPLAKKYQKGGAGFGYIDPWTIDNWPKEGTTLQWAIKKEGDADFGEFSSDHIIDNQDQIKLRMVVNNGYLLTKEIVDSPILVVSDLLLPVDTNQFEWQTDRNLILSGDPQKGVILASDLPGLPTEGLNIEWAIKKGQSFAPFGNELLTNNQEVKILITPQIGYAFSKELTVSPSYYIHGLFNEVDNRLFEWPNVSELSYPYIMHGSPNGVVNENVFPNWPKEGVYIQWRKEGEATFGERPNITENDEIYLEMVTKYDFELWDNTRRFSPKYTVKDIGQNVNLDLFAWPTTSNLTLQDGLKGDSPNGYLDFANLFGWPDSINGGDGLSLAWSIKNGDSWSSFTSEPKLKEGDVVRLKLIFALNYFPKDENIPWFSPIEGYTINFI